MKKRIIAVDDDAGFARLLKRLMPEYDLQVETDACVALLGAMNAPPDLFLLDIVVPGMTGRDLACRIAALECFRNTPVIFFSALVQSPVEDGEPVLIYGRPAFGKPFDLVILKRHVAEHLSERATPIATICRLRRGSLLGE